MEIYKFRTPLGDRSFENVLAQILEMALSFVLVWDETAYTATKLFEAVTLRLLEN
jgi:hypothetical protein